MATSVIQSGTAPLFLGDDLALDFINSAYGPQSARVDHFEDPERTSAWFEAAGLATPAAGRARGALSVEARQLRDHARDLVERRKRGEVADPGLLNRVLAAGSAYATLDWFAGDVPSIAIHERAESTSGLLLPVANALATLLSTANFDLVRKCESDECTLWFHDRTRSHHRRWCSQATCGNRMKVAAFRARKRG
jgi:predicted RNA-binding Zn ribbon-like protein